MLPDYYNRLKEAGYESLGNELLELAVEQGADSKNVYSLLANAFISMSKPTGLRSLSRKQSSSILFQGMESFLCLRAYRLMSPRPVIKLRYSLLYYNLLYWKLFRAIHTPINVLTAIFIVQPWGLTSGQVVPRYDICYPILSHQLL